jgi:hypothetical protein
MSVARLFCLSAMVAIVAFSSVSTARAADPADADGLIQAHLAAGEFGPARALAQAAGNAGQRDRLLAQVAAAQAGSGARSASLDTASYISDDRVRSSALQQVGSQPFRAFGARGGMAQADFQPLIDLIKATIAPQSWDDVGGPGAIDKFVGGVYVDASGLLSKMAIGSGGRTLTELRSAAVESDGNLDVRKLSHLRKVSLTRLEKQVQMLAALGHEPDEAMRHLAGLQKVTYVLVYPETGDIVIAGPAGDWQVDPEGRTVSVDNGRPVLELDDLVVVLRNAYEQDSRFGCSITPTREGLARTKAFLEESAKTPLKPYQREGWLKQVRESLGKQNIEVNGVDPRTRVARVLVEADYRMKLVGMGLEDGTLGVKSYLASLTPPANGAPSPPMDVLRWWFTLNYEALQATETRDAFELRGQGVQVLSENELLNQRGERVHTGKSDELNHEFASSFTKQFPMLAAKYPIYTELQNVFDLALVSALIRAEDLPAQVGWHMTYFGPAKDNDTFKYDVQLGVAPTLVDTVINHRMLDRTHIVAGVSGGVSVDARGLVQRTAIKVDNYGLMKANRTASAPKNLPRNAWWWD